MMRTVRSGHGRVSVAVLLCSALVVLAPRSPWAGPAEAKAQENTAQVNDLVERGIALRRAGDDQRALMVFQQAEKLQPRSARVLVHLAAAHQALGQWEDADRYLALALDNPNDPYVQKHQAMLASARRTIDGHVASLDIIGGPRGAKIWLNGRALGTLPLAAPVRVAAGIYTLEARLAGHYPVIRSVALGGGSLVREQILLAPEVPRQTSSSLAEVDAGVNSSSKWLPWTFAGLAAGAGAGAVVALVVREQNVDRFNDDTDCLPTNNTPRGVACEDELDAGKSAETWMWVGTAAAGAFAAASIVTFLLMDAPDSDEQSTALSCGVGLGLVECAGRF